MSTQITGDRWGTEARIATDPTAQRAQDSMTQLARKGQDTALRSLQVWADLARNFGITAPSSAAGATMFSLAHNPFEKLLVAQRQIVDELVAAQRELTQQLVDATAAIAAVDDHPVRR
jgi:hypothetical protein